MESSFFCDNYYVVSKKKLLNCMIIINLFINLNIYFNLRKGVSNIGLEEYDLAEKDLVMARVIEPDNK